MPHTDMKPLIKRFRISDMLAGLGYRGNVAGFGTMEQWYTNEYQGKHADTQIKTHSTIIL